jgi:prepilin-type N-terminal cleavage/methylation domain-containing protein
MVTRSEAGVTLVELVVTLAIIGALAAVATMAPSLLRGGLLGGRVKGASDELAAAIRYARQLAITEAQDHCIGMGVVSGVAQYQLFLGGRSGTSCTGTSVGNPVTLSGTPSPNIPDLAFVFTPVSTVDPVGPTAINITSTDPNSGQTCTVTLTVTGEGGVQLPPAICS